MFKRILNFDKQNWQHIGWLLKTMIKNFIKGDINEFIEGFYLIKLHLSYDSKRIK
jgi:hypothetical protein